MRQLCVEPSGGCLGSYGNSLIVYVDEIESLVVTGSPAFERVKKLKPSS